MVGLQDFYSISSGVYVKANDRSDNPNIKYGGITVQNGVLSNIQFSREVYKMLPLPYNNCRKDLTELQSDSKYFKLTSRISKYSRIMCMDIYKQINDVLPVCKCYYADLKIQISERICQNTSEISKKKFSFYIILSAGRSREITEKMNLRSITKLVY